MNRAGKSGGRSSGTAVLVVLVIALATGTLSATAQSQSRVRVFLAADILEVDPARAEFQNDLNHLYVNVFDALVIRNREGALDPHLARSWRLLSPTEWEFRLREGVKFHNGEPFTAESVKATVERFLEPGKLRATTVQASVAGARVIDDRTVVVSTKRPDPMFLERLERMFITPKDYLQRVGEAHFARVPVGTGPFKWKERGRASHVALVANSEYWAGPPKVSELVFRIVPEPSSRVAALRAGEADIIVQVPPDEMERINAQRGIRVEGVRTPRMIYLQFYPESPRGGGRPFADPRVRKAVAYGIDYDALIRNLLASQADRAGTMLPPQTFGHNPNIRPHPYDPGRARALLAEAGYPNGFAVDFDIPTAGNWLKPTEIGLAIAADLKKVGISVVPKTHETNTYYVMKNERQIGPLYMWNWAAFDGERMLFAQVYSRGGPRTFYYPGHSSEVDRLILAISQEMNVERRKQLFWDLQERLAEDMPHIVLYRQNDLFGVSNRIQWLATPGGYVFGSHIGPRR